MINRHKWVKFEGNPIHTALPGMFTEDFEVVEHDGKYYAFFSEGLGYGALNTIGMATADNPLGPFERYKKNPVVRFPTHLRLGSVIEVMDKWRMYFSVMTSLTGKEIVFMESDDLMHWNGRTLLMGNATHPYVRCLDDLYILMFTRDKAIHQMFSADGKVFAEWSDNPIIEPVEKTGYSYLAGNPTFIDDKKGEINIYFEGQTGKVDWKLFQAVQDARGIKVIGDVLPPTGIKGAWDANRTANPSVVKFGNKYYLYYGGFDKDFSVGVAYQ